MVPKLGDAAGEGEEGECSHAGHDHHLRQEQQEGDQPVQHGDSERMAERLHCPAHISHLVREGLVMLSENLRQLRGPP